MSGVPYCGMDAPPSGKRRGTLKECAERKQIRYYGVEKIDLEDIKGAQNLAALERKRKELNRSVNIFYAKANKLVESYEVFRDKAKRRGNVDGEANKEKAAAAKKEAEKALEKWKKNLQQLDQVEKQIEELTRGRSNQTAPTARSRPQTKIKPLANMIKNIGKYNIYLVKGKQALQIAVADNKKELKEMLKHAGSKLEGKNAAFIEIKKISRTDQKNSKKSTIKGIHGPIMVSVSHAVITDGNLEILEGETRLFNIFFTDEYLSEHGITDKEIKDIVLKTSKWHFDKKLLKSYVYDLDVKGTTLPRGVSATRIDPAAQLKKVRDRYNSATVQERTEPEYSFDTIDDKKREELETMIDSSKYLTPEAKKYLQYRREKEAQSLYNLPRNDPVIIPPEWSNVNSIDSLFQDVLNNHMRNTYFTYIVKGNTVNFVSAFGDLSILQKVGAFDKKYYGKTFYVLDTINRMMDKINKPLPENKYNMVTYLKFRIFDGRIGNNGSGVYNGASAIYVGISLDYIKENGGLTAHDFKNAVLFLNKNPDLPSITRNTTTFILGQDV